jgi:hypothetical protein
MFSVQVVSVASSVQMYATNSNIWNSSSSSRIRKSPTLTVFSRQSSHRLRLCRGTKEEQIKNQKYFNEESGFFIFQLILNKPSFKQLQWEKNYVFKPPKVTTVNVIIHNLIIFPTNEEVIVTKSDNKMVLPKVTTLGDVYGRH